MSEYIDFSISPAEFISFLSVLLFPIVLMLIARIKRFRNRNALQLFLTSLIVFFLWMLGIFFTEVRPSTGEVIVSSMIFIITLLVYLELWALLSRGYTLGILLTLTKSPTPLSDRNLMQSYRSGEGLEWLVSHRFSSLFAAKLVIKRGNKVFLTSFMGNTVVYIYRLFIWIFSLKRTG